MTREERFKAIDDIVRDPIKDIVEKNT